MYTLVFLYMVNMITYNVVVENIQTVENCHNIAQQITTLTQVMANSQNYSYLSQFQCYLTGA